jgi:hypothetical protein
VLLLCCATLLGSGSGASGVSTVGSVSMMTNSYLNALTCITILGTIILHIYTNDAYYYVIGQLPQRLAILRFFPLLFSAFCRENGLVHLFVVVQVLCSKKYSFLKPIMPLRGRCRVEGVGCMLCDI